MDETTIREGPSHLVTTKNTAARFTYKASVTNIAAGTTEELVYVDELDAFVRQSQVPDLSKCFDKSQEHLQLFKATMARFIQNMETRKAFKGLDIDLKDPAFCDLSFVFKVATAAVEKREGTGSLRTCKEFARKCAKSANRKDTVLGAIMGMIPGDIYGSVISGSVMTILAVTAQHENRKQAIENALAEIPKKLQDVQMLSGIHHKSKRLHEKGDGVLVAIFVVLEAIINKLTMGKTAKFKSIWKFETDDEVTVALSSLDTSLKEFESALRICTEMLMGRMDEGLQRIERYMGEMHAKWKEEESNVVTKEDLAELRTETVNAFYQLVASNPNFDPKTGTRRLEYTETSDHRQNVDLSQRNKDFVDRWCQLIGNFNTSSEDHMQECIRAGLGQLSVEDREKSRWIISSAEIRDWLRLDKSSILSIRAEDAPEGLFHPLSFTAALLAKSLQGSTAYPVVSFFCGLRTNESLDREQSGSMAVLKSLVGQFLAFCLRRNPAVDVHLLETGDKELVEKSTEKPRYALRLFRRLLELLRDQEVVFVILESWSRLSGGGSDADKIIQSLSRMITGLPNRVLKVLVLDALPSDATSELADATLHVPSAIDGWRNDVQLEELEDSNKSMVEELRETQKRKREDMAESDSEDTNGDSSDS